MEMCRRRIFTFLCGLLTLPLVHLHAKEMEGPDFKAILGKGEVLSLVDPRIETESCRWFHSSPAARPFGMAKVVPHTFNQRWRAGYDARRPHALGFCHLHGWQSTGLEVMPTAGGDFEVDRGEEGWSSPTIRPRRSPNRATTDSS